MEQSKDMADEQLMLAVQAGDYHAFEALYRRRGGVIYRQIFLWVGCNQADAEDIAQQTWLAIRTAKRYEPTAKFLTWALTIAKNKILTWQDKPHMHVESVSTPTDEEDDPLMHVADPALNPEGTLSRKQCAQVLLRCIELLTTDQREALLCKEDGDLNVAETSVVLNKNYSTVKNLISKAYKNLRKCLENTLGESLDQLVAGFSLINPS